MARMLTIRVLGPFEVSADGIAVEVPTGRLRALLANLAMAAGEAVQVERLAAVAWDGDTPDNLRRTVQLYITRLRALLGKNLIHTKSAGYALLIPADQVDALRFLGLLEAAATESDWSRERKLLGEALALWRGNPFEGVYSSRLEESEGLRLIERYLSAVERRLDLDIADGRAADIVAELAELAAEHPLRETLWVRWLVALADCNRQAEALARYEAVRSLLAEELGADPGPELQAAYTDLLAGRGPSGLGSSPARRIPRQLPPDTVRFTGRPR